MSTVNFNMPNGENARFELEMSRKRFLVKALLILGAPTIAFFMISDVMEGRYLVTSLEAVMAMALITLFLALHKTTEERTEYVIYRICLTVFIILFGTLFIYAVGVEGKFSRTQWCYIYPLLVFFLVGPKEGLLWVLLFYGGMASLLAYSDFQPVPLEELKARFLISFFLICILSFLSEYLVRRSQRRLLHNQDMLKKSENRYREAYEELKNEIKERRQAEQALKESENKYRLLAENASDVIWTTDMNLRLTYVSLSVNRLGGRSADEFMAESIADFLTEDSMKAAMKVLAEELAIEEDLASENKQTKDLHRPRTFELEFTRKDGTTFWTEAVTDFIRDESGKPVGILGVSRDINERKKAEEEKRKLEAQLQRAQKMEAIGTLAGGVAHDLNNILAGLVSYPDLLLLEIPEDSPLRKPMLIIKKSGEKAAAIVQDLLTLARRGVAVAEVVNLNQTISEYLRSPEHENLKSFHPDIEVETNLEIDLLHISGSPAHLSKTIMNLVSNAAEAMLGGGTISISTENRYIDRPIRSYDHVEEGDYAVLRVSDTGVGITSEDMGRIFEPFYTKKVMGRSGTGLGMAVVWGTVKDHKGYIDIQSTKGKGTTFTLYFPVTRKEVAKDEPILTIEDHMGKGESILVVDDVEEQREIASRILRKLGYSVTTVASGEEAVEYLKDNSADLLVLDMIMDHGIDGLDTYKRIIEFHPGQKALIVSGFSETERVKEAQRLGAGAYVRKPFLLEKIGMAVKAELGK